MTNVMNFENVHQNPKQLLNVTLALTLASCGSVRPALPGCATGATTYTDEFIWRERVAVDQQRCADRIEHVLHQRLRLCRHCTPIPITADLPCSPLRTLHLMGRRLLPRVCVMWAADSSI